MPSQTYREFTPSHKQPPASTCKLLGDAPPQEAIEVSIYVKPRPAALPGKAANARAELLARRTAEHAADFALIGSFAADHGLTVSTVEPAKRLIKLSGTAAQFQAAFKTRLLHYHDGKRSFRARSGALSVPVELLPVIEAVLGLDTRDAARPRRVMRPAAAASSAFLPNQIAALYDFPTTVTGLGQCIALIELGGGYNDSDTAAAFTAMGLPPPTVVAVSVDGGANKPTPDDGADGEVALDIQV